MPRVPLCRLLSAVGALTLGLFLLPSVLAAAQLIQASDLLQLKQLESPALSPDGRWVVYVVRSIEPKPEAKDDWNYQTHLWLASVDGSAPARQLTRSGSDSSPTWHPGGDRIAFVRTTGEKEKPQIYVLPLAGGEAQPLTKFETGATNPHWSPDGTKLLFSSTLTFAQVRAALEKAGTDTTPPWSVEHPGRKANDTRNHVAKKKPGEGAKPEAETDKSKDEKSSANPDGNLQERREWLAKNEADGNPRSLTRLGFLSESDINPELTFTHLYVQEAREGAEARDLTPGYTGYSGAEWMADGRSLVCTGPANRALHPDRVETSSLYLVDAAAGGVKIFAELKDYTLANPQPSPDGKWVALTALPGEAFGYGQAVVATVPVTGGEPKLRTEKLDRGAGQLKWSPDSLSVYFTVASNGGFPLYRYDVVTDATIRMTKEEATGVRAYDVGRGVVAEVLTTPANPYELHAFAIGGDQDRTLTHHNSTWLSDRKLASTEAHSFVNQEGLTIQYWTLKPAEFDPGKKYPLLLEIHGGPQAMWGPGEDSMWFEFQYFAARGYAIVYSNPRGSGGYGYAFQHANHKDWGVGPSSDILSAADYAAKEPYVDKHRQVVTGGSYGGYMTAWIVGHDHRFKAAVAQRGVYDLTTFFGEGNAWRLVPRAFGGYPWEPETRRLLEHESPFTYVADITTPLLIQHGDNDRRTGFVQSEMMLKALKVLGREVEEVRYPRATHELSRSGEPRQRLDTLVRYEEFFRRYIGEN